MKKDMTTTVGAVDNTEDVLMDSCSSIQLSVVLILFIK